ncbi:hypothetical protein ACFX19_025967 [Malus domestica]
MIGSELRRVSLSRSPPFRACACTSVLTALALRASLSPVPFSQTAEEVLRYRIPEGWFSGSTETPKQWCFVDQTTLFEIFICNSKNLKSRR